MAPFPVNDWQELETLGEDNRLESKRLFRIRIQTRTICGSTGFEESLTYLRI